jgi:hypothetical protein
VATFTPNLRTPGNGLRMDRMGGISEGQHIPLTRRRVRHDMVDCANAILNPLSLVGLGFALYSIEGSFGFA